MSVSKRPKAGRPPIDAPILARMESSIERCEGMRETRPGLVRPFVEHQVTRDEVMSMRDCCLAALRECSERVVNALFRFEQVTAKRQTWSFYTDLTAYAWQIALKKHMEAVSSNRMTSYLQFLHDERVNAALPNGFPFMGKSVPNATHAVGAFVARVKRELCNSVRALNGPGDLRITPDALRGYPRVVLPRVIPAARVRKCREILKQLDLLPFDECATAVKQEAEMMLAMLPEDKASMPVDTDLCQLSDREYHVLRAVCRAEHPIMGAGIERETHIKHGILRKRPDGPISRLLILKLIMHPRGKARGYIPCPGVREMVAADSRYTKDLDPVA